jgi:ferritin-like metal-binding protein YciE
MSTTVEAQLVKELSHAHSMEIQAIRLLQAATHVAGDDEIAAVYHARLEQTAQHERSIAARLEAHGAHPSRVRDAAQEAAAVGVAAARLDLPDMPIRLAMTAFAFANHEIAAYRLLHGLARRAGDGETVAVVERILEQEEAAAEVVASTFERALEVTLDAPGRDSTLAPGRRFAG